MPKQTKIKLTYHVKAGEETKKTHKHVDYSIAVGGKVSAARSTVRTSENTESIKGQHTTNAQENNAGTFEWDEEVESNREAIDHAYLEHIEESALDDIDKAARVRPKGVSHSINWHAA